MVGIVVGDDLQLVIPAEILSRNPGFDFPIQASA
jgi:hypothetical protein